jgi:hypothetical protein
MPSFSYLTEAEVSSIISYLYELADVPGNTKQSMAVRETPERVGELVVKSTCHICHSAAGLNPTPQQLYDGQIPPLETLSMRVSQAHFIRKVTHGWPILMGDPPEYYRGRMPVFYYLTAQEAADAYLYLSYYPPVKTAPTVVVAASHQPPPSSLNTDRAVPSIRTEPPDPSPEARPTTSGMKTALIVAGLFISTVLVLMGGFAFTLREIFRMSAPHAHEDLPDLIPIEPQPEESPLVHT